MVYGILYGLYHFVTLPDNYPRHMEVAHTMKPTPPMLSAPPLIGHLLEFQKDRTRLFQRGLDTVGPLFGLKMLGSKTAVLIDPDYHKILFQETDKRLNMSKPYRFLKAAFGEVA